MERGIEVAVIKELGGHAYTGATATGYAHGRLRLQLSAIDTLSTALDGPAAMNRSATTVTIRRRAEAPATDVAVNYCRHPAEAPPGRT
ncbi:hypothetical protein [Streptomyces buecherae]|uniref:hypothetical protein n=1 Tax=Streptomyces buecherae TaxID=2763006 RepID=UPI00365F0553